MKLKLFRNVKSKNAKDVMHITVYREKKSHEIEGVLKSTIL